MAGSAGYKAISASTGAGAVAELGNIFETGQAQTTSIRNKKFFRVKTDFWDKIKPFRRKTPILLRFCSDFWPF